MIPSDSVHTYNAYVWCHLSLEFLSATRAINSKVHHTHHSFVCDRPIFHLINLFGTINTFLVRWINKNECLKWASLLRDHDIEGVICKSKSWLLEIGHISTQLKVTVNRQRRQWHFTFHRKLLISLFENKVLVYKTIANKGAYFSVSKSHRF